MIRETLPNLLSASRIILGALVLLLYDTESSVRFVLACIVTLLGVATDILDGYLARRWSIGSEMGYVLDGLGDRSFYLALILTFVSMHHLPVLIAWLLIIREVAIYAVRLMVVHPWTETNLFARRYSLQHALSMRLWILTYFVSDALAIHGSIRLTAAPLFRAMQLMLAILTIMVGYRSVWVILSSAGLQKPKQA